MSRVYTITNQPGQSIDVETREYTARTLQNARNLLCMHMGECPFDRKSGIDEGLMHMPVTEVNRLVFREVQRALRWEPDVAVTDARAVYLEDGTVYIEAMVSVKEG